MQELRGAGLTACGRCRPTTRLKPDGHQPRISTPLTHLHRSWHLFAQRLLRQSRVKSDLHHAGEGTSAPGLLCRQKMGESRRRTAGSVYSPQLKLCDALCNLGFYLALPVAAGIKMTTKGKARKSKLKLRICSTNKQQTPVLI